MRDLNQEEEKVLMRFETELKRTVNNLLRYNGWADKRGQDYGDGWTDALDQISTSLLGRESEDSIELLSETLGLEQDKTCEVENCLNPQRSIVQVENPMEERKPAVLCEEHYLMHKLVKKHGDVGRFGNVLGKSQRINLLEKMLE